MSPTHSKPIDIVATIGPACDTPAMLQELMETGMTIARLNTKHGTTAWHLERIKRIRAAAKKVGKSVPILLDLQGPEIRINLQGSTPFEVQKHENVHFVSKFQDKLQNQIQVPQAVIDSLHPENQVSLEDGTCEFQIVEKFAQTLSAKAINSCTVKDRKTMNTPGIVLDMPSLIPSDLEKLDMLAEESVDFVALSFVRDTTDLKILRNELSERKVTAKICAKIENRAALDNLEGIIEDADIIMVARGDLGVEIPMEELSFRQKQIIHLSRQKKKFVITATQMMKSMEKNLRPTRAEVCDVANAVFDGTDAVMLSEETAMGDHPVETVTIMRRIVDFNQPLIEKVKAAKFD